MLTPPEQKLHLFALSLTAIAIALVMTPAAFHRQTGPEKITGQFIRLATRLLLLGMLPLLMGLLHRYLSDCENNRGEPSGLDPGNYGRRPFRRFVVRPSSNKR